MGALDDLSNLLAPPPTGKTGKAPKVERRQGRVTDVDPATGLATVVIAEDPQPVPNVPSTSNYVPQIGDNVTVEVAGLGDNRITERVGDYGPSVYAGVAYAEMPAAVARAATTFGDLPSSAGPSVSVTVSPSGLLRVDITCEITTSSDNDGGAVGVALSGANTVAAALTKCIKFYPATDGAIAQMSRTLYYAGLSPGITNVTMQYSDLLDTGADVTYGNRELLVTPM